MTALPGGTTLEDLLPGLRRWTGRPGLTVDDVACVPVAHRYSAPTTRALTRVAVTARDGGEPLVLRLVVKELQRAREGLPPEVPPPAREFIDSQIPWRVEADVYTGPVRDHMPPGLRMPDLVHVTSGPGDRRTLWLEDVRAVDRPWSVDDVRRAATALGRLAVRRRVEPRIEIPCGSFLANFVANRLGRRALPLLATEGTWSHPAMRQPAVAALRDDLARLAGRVPALWDEVAGAPELPAHGDATPANVLRAEQEPGVLALLDWGTSTPAPVGYDVVPLVFGDAEACTAPPDAAPGLLDVAVPAYVEGLAAEGVEAPVRQVERAVVAAALLRYPFTSLPLDELEGPLTGELVAHAREKAAFVRMVLDLEPRLAALSGR
ncbi:phosphotransferase [Geodermatophilus sp. SYSU D01119]